MTVTNKPQSILQLLLNHYNNLSVYIPKLDLQPGSFVRKVAILQQNWGTGFGPSLTVHQAPYLYKNSVGLQMLSFPELASGRSSCIFRSILP